MMAVARARRGRFVHVLLRSCAAGAAAPAVVAMLLASTVGPAAATDLYYTPMSPNFGGSNAIAFQMAQFQNGLKAQRAAAQAAAAKALLPTDPNQQFVTAIISQLNGLVAQTIAQKIANSQQGQSGTIQSGGVTITYVNSDGQLNVTIVTPTGSTVLNVPSGN